MGTRPGVAAAGRPFPEALLYFIFFLSGLAAILYQLVWQRSLFTIYGTSSESVTIVVTVFMLGLGLGSLAGGRLSRGGGWRLPLLFGVTEVFIGAFGLASGALLERVAGLTAGAAGLEIGLWAFALLLVPTVCMGATLPMLAAYAVARSGNVGRSLGTLYFVNTLGSAAGCFVAGQLLFGLLGKHATVQLAAAVNFLVAACVLAARAARRP